MAGKRFIIKYDMLEGHCEQKGLVTFTVENPTNPHDPEGMKKLGRLLELCQAHDTQIVVRGPNLHTSIPLQAVTEAVLEDSKHLHFQFINHVIGFDFPHGRVQEAISKLFTGACPGLRKVPDARGTDGDIYIVTNRTISNEEAQKLWNEEAKELWNEEVKSECC